MILNPNQIITTHCEKNKTNACSYCCDSQSNQNKIQFKVNN